MGSAYKVKFTDAKSADKEGSPYSTSNPSNCSTQGRHEPNFSQASFCANAAITKLKKKTPACSNFWKRRGSMGSFFPSSISAQIMLLSFLIE